MTIQAHLVELERKHKTLENELHEALVHLSTDDLQIVELKRRRLMVKDQIERLSLTFAKRHLHAARAVFEVGHAVPEPHVDSVLDRFVERRSQRRTRKAHAPALDELLHRALVEAAVRRPTRLTIRNS